MVLSTYRFGEFRFDPAKRELWRGDTLVPLQLKVCDVLAYLIENRERAVGRDELIAAVWGKTDVTDNVLGQIVGRARHAIGDTGDDQRLIRTVLRFGYRWLAPVECIDGIVATPQAPAAIVDADVATPTRARTTRTHRAALALAFALLVAAGGIAWFAATRTPAPAAAGAALVLPVTVTADDSYAWVRLGVMDLVANRLRAAGQAVVPSDNVVALMQRQDEVSGSARIAAFARGTSTALVIEPQASHANGRWHVTLKTTRGRDPPLSVESESSDVLDAAATAADRMALALGFPSRRDGRADANRSLAIVLQRVEAAVLAGDIATARGLIDGLDQEQRALPEILFQRARIDVYAGRFADAESGFDALLDSVSAKDDPVMRGRALIGLAAARLGRGDSAGAEQSADLAVRLLDTQTSSRELGQALMSRAVARSNERKFDAAVADFASARIALETAGDALGVARLDVGLGQLESDRDHFSDVVPALEAGGRRLALFQDVKGELAAYSSLAYAQLALLDATGALATDAYLRDLAEQDPDPRQQRFIDVVRARVLAANGRTRESDALLRDLRRRGEEAKDTLLLAGLPSIEARHALASGRYADAARLADASVHAAWDTIDPREYARTWLTLVRAELAQNDAAGAARSAAAASAWAERSGTPAAKVYAALAVAEAAAAHDAPEARNGFEGAVAAAEADRVPRDELEAYRDYVGYLIRTGDLAQAAVIGARAAGWAAQDYEAALLQLRLYHMLGRTTAWQGALERARALAGERAIPPDLLTPPAPAS